MISLYQALKAAGIETDHHESDLYFWESKQSLAILAQYPEKLKIATRFRNQRPPNVGEIWLEVPFAYEPFWEAASRRAALVPTFDQWIHDQEARQIL